MFDKQTVYNDNKTVRATINKINQINMIADMRSTLPIESIASCAVERRAWLTRREPQPAGPHETKRVRSHRSVHGSLFVSPVGPYSGARATKFERLAVKFSDFRFGGPGFKKWRRATFRYETQQTCNCSDLNSQDELALLTFQSFSRVLFFLCFLCSVGCYVLCVFLRPFNVFALCKPDNSHAGKISTLLVRAHFTQPSFGSHSVIPVPDQCDAL